MAIVYHTIITTHPTLHAFATVGDTVYIHSSYDVAFLRLQMAIAARYASLLPRISEEYGEARKDDMLFGWIERHVVTNQEDEQHGNL